MRHSDSVEPGSQHSPKELWRIVWGVCSTTSLYDPRKHWHYRRAQNNTNLVIVVASIQEDQWATGVTLTGVLANITGTQHGGGDAAGVIALLTLTVAQHLWGPARGGSVREGRIRGTKGHYSQMLLALNNYFAEFSWVLSSYSWCRSFARLSQGS